MMSSSKSKSSADQNINMGVGGALIGATSYGLMISYFYKNERTVYKFITNFSSGLVLIASVGGVFIYMSQD